jgi:hypothetical protein
VQPDHDGDAPAGGKTRGEARGSLRGAGSAALRGLLRARDRVARALGSAAGRLKETDTGERLNAALEVRRAIKRAEAAHARGNPAMAFRLLEEELRARPGEEKLTVAFWRTCVALERAPEAADGLLHVIRKHASAGDLPGAASLWSELMDVVPDARADAGTLLRIVPVLYEIDRERGLRALHGALDPATPGLTPGLAMRAVEVARSLDPASCLRAARMALESKDLADAKRTRLLALIAELERAPAPAQPARSAPAPATRPGAPARPAAATAQAAHPAAPQPARSAPAATRPAASAPRPPVPRPPAARPLAARSATAPAAPIAEPAAPDPGSAEDFAEVLIDETVQQAVEATVEAFAPAIRFSSVKAVDAVPRELADYAVELRMDDGRNARIAYAKIQAVAVAEVAGLGTGPVVVIDLVLNWSDDDGGPLRVVRLRGDRFDAEVGVTDPRAFLARLLAHVEAPALPDSGSALGHPFRSYRDLDSYQREVLQAG